MKLELSQKLQQQQILAPQMILSMDILLLATQELQQRIEQEFQENPALELVEKVADRPIEESPEPRLATGENFDSVRTFEGVSTDHRPPRSRSAGESDAKSEALQNSEGKAPGLRDFLTQQLRLLNVDELTCRIGEEIINNLDHRGYLVATAEEVFASIGDTVAREDFENALAVVRSLDPAGVGAEDLRECLLLQLARDPQDYPLETEIIVNYLEDVRDNRIPRIAKSLRVGIPDVMEAIDVIRCLDPLPGSRYEPSSTIYVKPDVVVDKIEDTLSVRVERSSLPEIRISEDCKSLLHESKDRDLNKFVRKKVESAQWLIQAIEQRQRTLAEISKAIVKFQHDFMTKGPEHIRAMKMQTIADIVGVHISTVSRAIKGKYMETPWGLFEMRYFFTGGVENGRGVMESRRNIYRRIRELIDGEDKKRPLSDAEIARLLREDGLSIARRTVTKYREQRNIPSSRLRKVHWVAS